MSQSFDFFFFDIFFFKSYSLRFETDEVFQKSD